MRSLNPRHLPVSSPVFRGAGQGARTPWYVWPGLLALVLALCLVPVAGRMHQVVHGVPLEQALIHGPAHVHAGPGAGASMDPMALAAQTIEEGADEPASLAHHQPASALCVLLDQLALGNAAPAGQVLALPAPVPAGVPTAAVRGVATPPSAHFQARAPPASPVLA